MLFKSLDGKYVRIIIWTVYLILAVGVVRSAKEYKWRPRPSKRNHRLGHRDINDDRNTWNINDNQDTGGHTGIYKWRRRHRESSISNHHQQSSRAIIRIMRYRSEYGLFSHGPLYVACSRVGKPDNLFICTDNGTAKNVVYSQVLRS